MPSFSELFGADPMTPEYYGGRRMPAAPTYGLPPLTLPFVQAPIPPKGAPLPPVPPAPQLIDAVGQQPMGLGSPNYLGNPMDRTPGPAQEPGATPPPEAGAGEEAAQPANFGFQYMRPGGYRPLDEVALKYRDQAASAGIPGLGSSATADTNAAAKKMTEEGDYRNAAVQNQALTQAVGLGDLSKLNDELAAHLTKRGLDEKFYAEHDNAAIKDEMDKYREDNQWLRDNAVIDPYKKFKTNAGAGILFTLGTIVSGIGAGLSGDQTGNWQKHIDALLGREFDAQVASYKQRSAATDKQGQLIRHLVESSRDMAEARNRWTVLQLETVNKKAEAIKQRTDSQLVRDKADEFIHANNINIAQTLLSNVYMPREGNILQENIARMGAGVTRTGQNLDYAAKMAALDQQNKQLELQMTAPMLKRVNDLRTKGLAVETTLNELERALVENDGSVNLNTLSSAARQNLADFYGGVNATGAQMEDAELFGSLKPWDWAKKPGKQFSLAEVQAMRRHVRSSLLRGERAIYGAQDPFGAEAPNQPSYTSLPTVKGGGKGRK